MPFNNYWRHADAFTLVQAAALWCEIEPPHSIILPRDIPAEFFAARQALKAGIQTGKIPTKSNIDLDFLVNWDDVTVLRSDLIEWFEAKREFPPFLFDTALPIDDDETPAISPSPQPHDGTNTSANLHTHSDALSKFSDYAEPSNLNEGHISQPSASAEEAFRGSELPPPKIVHKKGRGPNEKHNWDYVAAKIIEYVHDYGFPDQQADLWVFLYADYLEKWSKGPNGTEPDESLFKKRVSLLVQLLKKYGINLSKGGRKLGK